MTTPQQKPPVKATPKKPRPTNQKSKGNKYERDTAKKLSKWMFNDPTILYKHEDSGARKVVYNGDITVKHVSKYPWKIFPFVIECKNGYAQNIPTLMNQNHLKKWLVKLLNERTDEQRIPLFIAQYHHQIPILMTTVILNFGYQLALVVPHKGVNEFFYVYKFNELMKRDFLEMMPDWFTDVVKKDDVITKDIDKNTDNDIRDTVDKIVDDRPLTKKEENAIMGDIIGDILGIP